MEDWRSKSCGDGRMQMEVYGGHELRCYSATYTSSAPQQTQKDLKKLKKSKTSGGSSSKNWSFNDPELQRKKRVASYKVYSVEGKMKGSFRKSFRWLKDRYTQVVYGWR
ncbi:uncharacterized protein LOC131217682 [Magnolia sinica]|uniref:uncharacterized protein LOC131217682 n=1 Tax=Magnolia sinica TaxID=86752 RepID=UPI00265A6261|nr:uncharacterized protein LOC131217682 [Magnolia sinica]